MKTLTTLITILLIAITFDATSQSFIASTYMEQTHVSPKLGTTIGYSFDSQIEIGGFYQNASSDLSKNSESTSLEQEEEFYGAYFSYPVVDRAKTGLQFNIRTGVVNGQNFLITPSLLGNYKIMNNISVGAGVGIRTFRPTLQASIKLNL